MQQLAGSDGDDQLVGLGEQGAAGAAASIAAEAATEGTAHEQARLLALERQLLNVDPVAEVRAHPIVFWTVTNSLILLCKQDEDGRDSSQDRNADADNLSTAATSDADIEGESLGRSGVPIPGSGLRLDRHFSKRNAEPRRGKHFCKFRF